MKILYFGNKLSKHGYSPTVLESLSRLLQSNQMDVYTSSDKKNKLMRLLDMLVFFFKERRGTDVILIDTYSTLNFWYAVMIGRLSSLYGIKYIPILHGGKLPNRLDRSAAISRKLFMRSAVNVAPSGYLYDEFYKRGYHNTVVIPNFIDEDNYQPQQRTCIGVPKLLWVRSFSEVYNPQMAIKVLSEVRKTYPTASLLMIGGSVGGEECFSQTQQLAESMGLSGAVEFTGKLTKNEWIARSVGCNIFINTTNADNTPVSVIEAMALGLPVVSTNVGGIPYVIADGDNGLLVEAGSVEAMAKSIVRIAEDNALCAGLSQAAINASRKYFSTAVKGSWTTLLQQMVECK